ncbi:EAL domain-containing protein [Alkalilimnicola sp. S0819]|uniref:EAL domain-containing protein n=1 Tax=Alkalilimnicola sp. S0819 TaxID=2613922 RepID=UPI00186A1F21|nr:EAL domain-containing protein [Alkalilimnicola sp. S0819]
MKRSGARILRASLLMLCLLAAPALGQELRVGVYQNEPKVFVNDAGEPAGIFVDLLREIAQREDWTLRFQRCEWDDCLRQLRAGTLDLMPDVAWSANRAGTLDFHQQPALYARSQIFAPPEARLISVFQLQHLRIAVLRDSVQHESFGQLLRAFGVDAVLVPVRSLEQGLRTTAKGQTDAVISDDRFGLMYAPRYGLEATPIVFDPTPLYFAAAGGRQSAVLRAIDDHLLAWRADNDSPYYRVLRRWQPERGGLIAAVPSAVWWGLGILAVALSVTLVLVFWMRRLIARRTRSLRESEQRLETILDSVGAFIYIKDRELRYTYANQAARELLGRSNEQIIGLADADFLGPAAAQRLSVVDQRVLEHGEAVQTEEQYQETEHREPRTFLSQKIPLRDASGAIYGLCGIATDITERKRTEETVRRIAYYDTLTGLPNRSYLLERLRTNADEQAGREPGLQALIYIDLDAFKDLNDTLDHEVGDELLRQVGQRLEALAQRQKDVHAVRLGGDEFALLLEGLHAAPGKAQARAEALARQAQDALGEEYQLKEELRYQGSCSIGLSLSQAGERGGEQADQLLRHAEMAMYRAKQAGRNAMQVFSPEIEAALAERINLEADMRRGLAQGQFRLAYQPQVDQEGRVIGAEALLRWQHPQRGNISPGVFIPLAEHSGLILPLGHWVLETACAQLARWAQSPRTAGLSLAVNLSARQFRASGFVEELTALLERSGAPAARLKLELTETLLIEDLEEAATTAQRLSRLGVRFSLDDFGTGYSSLAYLKRLPLSQLKIDQSFVRDILSDPVAEAIARSIISLGASLELAVIAEGVETQAQRQRLRELGCHTYQGFLFGFPDEVAVLEAML